MPSTARPTAVLGSGKAIPLHYAGRGLALREKAAPILFCLTQGLDPVAIGIILVFVPLFALSDIEGRLFAPLGVA